MTINLCTRHCVGPDKEESYTENGISVGARSSCHLPRLVPAAAMHRYGWLRCNEGAAASPAQPKDLGLPPGSAGKMGTRSLPSMQGRQDAKEDLQCELVLDVSKW